MNKRGMADLTAMDAQCIIAFADNGMRMYKAAEAIYTHRTNIRYHLRRTREKTGKDPWNPLDLAELLPLAHEIVEMEENARK